MPEISKNLIILMLGAAIGVALQHNRKKLSLLRYFLAKKGLLPYPKSNRISAGRDQLQRSPQMSTTPIASQQRVAVLLTAGQSNAANEGAAGEPLPEDDLNILNLHNGACYVARHPLLGATGKNQSPSISVARRLLDAGNYDKVVIIATAIGGTGIQEWAPRGQFHERLLQRVREANAAGLTPTHFLWHQGEYDALESPEAEAYQLRLTAIINAVRKTAAREIPAFIALATRVTYNGPVDSIRQAQQNTVESVPLTYAAIDSDQIGLEHRFDGVHMTKSGLEILATGYAQSILAAACLSS